MPEQTTTSRIPVIGTFEQIKAGLGFGPKKPATAEEITADRIAGRINEIAEPQGKRLNRFTEEWAQVVEAVDAGLQGAALAQKIIALGATQGFVITLDQLLQPAPLPIPTAPVGIPTPGGAVTVDAAGNVILDPGFAAAVRPRTTTVTGARGLFPSGFPILPPRGATSTPSGTTGGFNFARFIQCLIGSLLPSQGGQRMPFQVTPGPQASSGGFDFGGFVSGALDVARNIFSAPQAPASRFPELRPAGFSSLIAPATRALGPLFAGAAGGAIGQSLFDFGGAATLDESAAFTDPIPGSCRPKAHVKTNPCTGRAVWFVPRGRPLVFSGDMSACKRVDRVAKRLDKARPKRRHHHHTKRRPR